MVAALVSRGMPPPPLRGAAAAASIFSVPGGLQRRVSNCSNEWRLPPRLTVSRASRLLLSNRLTAQELCRHAYHLASFGESALRLNAYAKLLSWEEIAEQARKSDERIRSGEARSRLEGLPVTIKANIAAGGYWEMPHAGSAILAHEGIHLTIDDVPASRTTKGDVSNNGVYESDIARRLLKECGAILIGTTNLDEFGMGSLGTNNGVHCNRQLEGRLGGQRGGYYSPTYNPLPWMHRISSLLSADQQRLAIEDTDAYWLERICHSTEDNPHGVVDDTALARLLEEVQYWVDGDTPLENDSDVNTSPLLAPGGSSAGAAAATSHGSALFSVGTDTGGSLRLPAAWTATVGFKPSYGTFSRYGVVSYASSLDTVGFVAGTAECANIAWRCLREEGGSNGSEEGGTGLWNGRVNRDSTARVYHDAAKMGTDGGNFNGDDPSTGTTKPLADVRVGIPSAFSLEELPRPIADAWNSTADRLQRTAGATLVSIPESQVSAEWLKLALAAYYVLACAEASSNLSRYDGVRYGMELDPERYIMDDMDSANVEDYRPLLDMNALETQISATRAFGFGEEVQRRVLAGTSVLSSDRFHTHYEAAAVVRARLSRSLENAFRSSMDATADGDKVDVMLVPTALSFPCALNSIAGDGAGGMDPTEAFANDVMTIPISLGGFPSISVPFQTDDERSPIGMQVFSSRGSEDLVLRVASALQ
ncbi:hypothetical protein ACHAXT_000289 [Thalassiosira profunda]